MLPMVQTLHAPYMCDVLAALFAIKQAILAKVLEQLHLHSLPGLSNAVEVLLRVQTLHVCIAGRAALAGLVASLQVHGCRLHPASHALQKR